MPEICRLGPEGERGDEQSLDMVYKEKYMGHAYMMVLL